MWSVILFVLGAVVLGGCYDVGSEYRYSYETTALVDEQCRPDSKDLSIGQKIRGKVHITPVQHAQRTIYRILIKDPELHLTKKSSFGVYPSELSKSPARPSYLVVENGVPQKILEDAAEYATLRNLKRGLASLLRVQRQNGAAREVDVSGPCEVTFEVKGDSVRKSKTNCIPFDNSTSMAAGSRSIRVVQHSLTDYDMLDGTSHQIAKATLQEHLQVSSNLWTKPTLCIHSKSELIFEGVSKDSTDARKEETFIEQLKENSLYPIYVKPEEKRTKKLSDSVIKYQDSLKTTNLAKTKSATAFYKLLPLFRSSSKDEIITVLENKKFKIIKPQLLDLVAASSTESSVRAAFQHFAHVKDYDESLERFLISLSTAARVDAFILQQVKSFTGEKDRGEKIHATLISTFGALLKTYAENEKTSDTKMASDFLAYLERGLADCSVDGCMVVWLLGLRNAARPESDDLLIKYSQKGGKVGLEAITAFNNIRHLQLSKEARAALLSIVQQSDGRRHDRSSRAIAAALLLRHDAQLDVVRVVLRALADQRDEELATHLAHVLQHVAREDPALRHTISKLLLEKDIGHYYTLAQKGSSSLSVKPLLHADGMNVTYSIELEMLKGGLLKRSIFDVNFKSDVGTSDFLTVGIFAEGLGSLAGGGDGDEWEAESSDPMAGLELTVLGAKLRPYVFFRSTSELMGHAWSGTASEPTPALQGIFPLSDDEQVWVLGSGFPVRVQLRGVLSADSSGSIQVSLWNRNSQSLVKNAGCFLVRGSATLDSGVAVSQAAFQTSAEATLDFETDTEFAESPFKLCIKMHHPPIALKYDLHRRIVSNEGGRRFELRRTKRRSRHIEGHSFPLHKKNSEMCTEMDSS